MSDTSEEDREVRLEAELEPATLKSEATVKDYHRAILSAAEGWIAQGEFDVAIVFLQTACEILTEQVFDTIMKKMEVGWLKEHIDDLPPNYNIGNERVRKLYVALTDDKIEEQPFWGDFEQHVTLRHELVHGTRRATREEAERSLASVSAVISHLEAIARNL